MTSHTKPSVIFVLGGPGAGKGTQCARLVTEFGYVHLSAGDLLRIEMNSGSKHGTMIAEMMNNGQIVPSEVTVGLLDKAMKESGKSRFLIDGFPRNEENNNSWEKEMKGKAEVQTVLVVDCPENIMMDRLIKRARGDDKVDTIMKRFQTFKSQTQPVIAYYAQQNKVLRVNGDQSEDVVWAEVRAAVEKLNQ